MRIDIISLFPQMVEAPLSDSIIKRAKEKSLVEIHIHNLRDYSTNKHKKVDDYQYGGGAGMVMSPEPISILIDKLKAERDYDEIIFTAPDGEKFTQNQANRLSMLGNLIILCGHYKGVDQRIRDHYITKELSIGDYVLTGGELAAAVMSDAIIRLIPGVLNDESSALTDSFQNGLLSAPVYTRPSEFNGWKVPDVLLSGHDKKIEEWRFEKSLEKTKERRPDLLEENE